jgi:hypothetical protein
VRPFPRLALIALAAGCSIPPLSLADKSCPCASGYTCSDAGICVPNGSSGSDGPASLSCLGTDPQAAPLISDPFEGTMLNLAIGAGTWADTGGQAVQSDAAANLAFAYASSTELAAQRVTVELHPQGSGGGLGIAFRVGLGQKTQYDCVWDPANHLLRLQQTNNGGQPAPLATQPVPDADPASTPLMEVLAQSSTLTCCLRNVAGSKFTATSTMYPMGYGGLVTVDQAAAFDNLSIYGQ